MRAAAPLLALALAASPAAAQPRSGAPAARMLDAELMGALEAIERPELAGVFAFVAPDAAPLALAALLYQDQGALKRYLRRMERLDKELGGISSFDKQALLYLVGMHSMGDPPRPAGAEPLSKKLASRVNELALRRVLTDAESDRARRRR